MKKCIISFLMILSITFTSFMLNSNLVIAADSSYSNTSDATISSELTLENMPESYQSSIEWVWINRMIKEGTPNFKNLIFDQIYAGDGSINYIVRWQSSKNLTLQQREKIATMINRQVNNWTKCLKGYDGWPYDEITVKVVGWACADSSQILDRQSDEIIYTDYITDDLSKDNADIPAILPTAPSDLSRAEHYWDLNYSYPGGLDKRFDMYLWGTTNFFGGAGGDWGQRVSDEYILNTLDLNEVHIIEHELGHGFGLPDFYEETDRPPGGFPDPTIMWAGNSSTITDWDAWMLRYAWSELKADTSRFPTTTTPTAEDEETNDETLVNIESKATVTTSYVSPWENISALNDGFEPVDSNDRNHLVYGNWPEIGVQWVQYDFDKFYTIAQSDVYWFKDNAGIDVPKSYKIMYLNGSNWEEVNTPIGLGTEVDKFNSTTFTPINTNAVRIEFTSDSISTGILEWKIQAYK